MRNTPEVYEVDKLSGLQLPFEVVKAIGTALGLTLFWSLEKARDGIFHLLDRMNLKPRIRRASAFPPGRPRRRRRVAIES